MQSMSLSTKADTQLMTKKILQEGMSLLPFKIPNKPEELEADELGAAETVRVERRSWESLEDEEVHALIQEALSTLDYNDSLYVSNEECFSGLYAAVRLFARIPGLERNKLVDVLCSSAHDVTTSAISLLASGECHSGTSALVQHCNALQQYAFLLRWLTAQADAGSNKDEREQRAATADHGTKKGGKGKAKSSSSGSKQGEWDWVRSRERVLKALGALLTVDLAAMLAAPHERQRMVDLSVEAVLSAFESDAAMKKAETRGAAFSLLLCITSRHGQQGQLEQLAEGLMAAARRHEHVADVVAQAAQYVEQQTHSSALADALVAQFCSVPPSAYDAEGESALSSVKNATELIACLAELVPKAVAAHLAQLEFYLGCNMVPVRSAIVHILAVMVCKDLGSKEDSNDQNKRGRARTKEYCFRLLCGRLCDKAAHVRVKALKAVAMLSEGEKINLPLWPPVLEAVSARLEDGSVLVQREALKTVQTIIEHNPFGAELCEDKASATLKEYEEVEKALRPASETDEAADPAWDKGDALEAVPEEEEGGTQPAAGTQNPQALDGTETQVEQLLMQPTQLESTQGGAVAARGVTWEQARMIIATMKTNLEFIQCIQRSLPILSNMLRAGNADTVREAIMLLTMLKKFGVVGIDGLLRSMWALIFSREETVREAVVDAVFNLYLRDPPGRHEPQARAEELVRIADAVNLGEATALDEVLGALCGAGDKGGDCELSQDVIHALLRIAKAELDRCTALRSRPPTNGGDYAHHVHRLRAALSILALVSAHVPDQVITNTPTFIKWLQSCLQLQDAWCVRQCCVLLHALAPTLVASPMAAAAWGDVVPAGSRKQGAAGSCTVVEMCCNMLTRVLATEKLPDEEWYTAADAAVHALYSGLHPAPHTLLEPFLQQLTTDVFPDCQQASCCVSATKLGRAVFLVGHTAALQLALIDMTAKTVRRQRADREKQAAAAAQQQDGLESVRGKKGQQGRQAEDDDIAAQVGGGSSVAADAALDSLRERTDLNLMAEGSLLGAWGAIIAKLCTNRALMQENPVLCASALLALAKLMAVDQAYCSQYIGILFGWMISSGLSAEVRCNLVVAMGDLTARWPNTVEPYTSHMYKPLRDTHLSVRRTCLMVLSHLILNDMMKVKGHIAGLARCLLDEDLREWSQRFFTTLAKRTTGARGGTNPIYNLLPDMLSVLIHEPDLTEAQFMQIMRVLLPFVKDTKQGDAFREKLCQRFEALQEEAAATASDFAAAQAAAQAGEGSCVMAGDSELPRSDAAQQQDTEEQAEAADTRPEAPTASTCSLNQAPSVPAQPAASGTSTAAQAPAQGQPGATTSHSSRGGVAREWHALALCLQEMGYSEKGARRVFELLRCYKHALGDRKVYAVFACAAEHARKHGDKKGDLRDLAKEYLASIEKIHRDLRVGTGPDNEGEVEQEQQVDKAEEEAAAAAAAPQAEGGGNEPVEGGTGTAGAAHDASSDDDQDVPLHSKRDRGRAVTPSGRAPAAKRGKRNGQTPAAMKGLRGKGAAGDQGSPTRPRGRQARVADDSESDGMDEDGSSDDGVAASDQRRPTASRTSSQAARKPQPAKKVRGGSRLDSKRASRRGGRAGLGSDGSAVTSHMQKLQLSETEGASKIKIKQEPE